MLILSVRYLCEILLPYDARKLDRVFRGAGSAVWSLDLVVNLYSVKDRVSYLHGYGLISFVLDEYKESIPGKRQLYIIHFILKCCIYVLCLNSNKIRNIFDISTTLTLTNNRDNVDNYGDKMADYGFVCRLMI